MTDTILFYDYGHPHLFNSFISESASILHKPLQILYSIDFYRYSEKPYSMLEQCKKHDIGQFI